MSSVDWGNVGETMIVWREPMQWQASENARAWTLVHTLATQRPQSVCLLVDMRQCPLPKHFGNQMRALMDASMLSNLKLVVIITAAPFQKMLQALFGSAECEQTKATLGCTVEIVISVDVAYALAEPYDR
jgi:hypothetical protein